MIYGYSCGLVIPTLDLQVGLGDYEVGLSGAVRGLGTIRLLLWGW